MMDIYSRLTLFNVRPSHFDDLGKIRSAPKEIYSLHILCQSLMACNIERLEGFRVVEAAKWNVNFVSVSP
jgi:hypothetical protein